MSSLLTVSYEAQVEPPSGSFTRNSIDILTPTIGVVLLLTGSLVSRCGYRCGMPRAMRVPGTVEALQKIIPAVRQRFGRKVRIIVLVDIGFAREEIMCWREENKVFTV